MKRRSTTLGPWVRVVVRGGKFDGEAWSARLYEGFTMILEEGETEEGDVFYAFHDTGERTESGEIILEAGAR